MNLVKEREQKNRAKIYFVLVSLFLHLSQAGYAQHTDYLRVHFLYGSRPLFKYRAIEQKWFGGILGGHVGIEGDSGKIFNFLPNESFHWFAHKKRKHSVFAEHTTPAFYSIFGGTGDVKKAIVHVPVSVHQKQVFDSIKKVYLKETPYDYAFVGMRCAAAAYEILAQVDVLPRYSLGATYRKIFYPRKLRKRLFDLSEANNWMILREEGSEKRKWEKD